MTEDRGQRPEDGGQKARRSGPSSVVRPPSSDTRRPFWRRLLKWTLLTIVGFIVLIMLLWAGLQTQWAKKQLAGFVADVTAKTGDYQVAIEGLDGLLPFSITLTGQPFQIRKVPGSKWKSFDFFHDGYGSDFRVGACKMAEDGTSVRFPRLPDSHKTPPKKENTVQKKRLILPAPHCGSGNPISTH